MIAGELGAGLAQELVANPFVNDRCLGWIGVKVSQEAIPRGTRIDLCLPVRVGARASRRLMDDGFSNPAIGVPFLSPCRPARLQHRFPRCQDRLATLVTLGSTAPCLNKPETTKRSLKRNGNPVSPERPELAPCMVRLPFASDQVGMSKRSCAGHDVSKGCDVPSGHAPKVCRFFTMSGLNGRCLA